MKINKNDIKKVCIDDFAIRKRKTYGTVLIDIENNTIIDMIDSREYNDIVSWLSTYPNIEVFSRDGSITYSSAIATSHPKAIQVSDRFHILKNLTSYCTNYLSKYLKDKIYIETENLSKIDTRILTNSQKNKMLSLKEKAVEAVSMYKQGIIKNKICKQLNLDIKTLNNILNLNESNLEKAFESKREIIYKENIKKKQDKIDEVRNLYNKGSKISHIAIKLSLDRRTVKKYLDKNTSAIGMSKRAKRVGKLTPYLKIIDKHIGKGYTSVEIKQIIDTLGYTGSSSTLRTYMAQWKKNNKNLKEDLINNKIDIIEKKRLLKLLYKPMDKVGFTCSQLEKIYLKYPNLKIIFDLVNEFRDILKYKKIKKLSIWIGKALKLKINELNSFISGLKRDIDAVKNAIIYDYNNGLAEGCINKIKLIKRIMFGRCSFETLKTKVLNLEYYNKIN